MPTVAAPPPGLVHYLPLLTTAVAAAFLAALLRRRRDGALPPHLAWWSFGILAYGAGTALESAITLGGNTPELTRWWYLAGAILGGYPLATGSVYLLCARSTAHRLTAGSGAVVAALAAAVLLTPLLPERLQPHRPSGDVLAWSWIRALTPVVNGYAALFLVGGALHSARRFAAPPAGHHRDGARALGTALIALGGLLPGIGGGLAKAGCVEALYVGELAGVLLLWAGHAACSRGGRAAAAA